MSLRPELLAPAGNWDCARAAIANGADAIYFGLDAFNARMRADNFTEGDLPALMALLHEHGLRGYLTLNILIFPEELAEAERLLRLAAAAGVDAVLVQDLGLARLARATVPELAVHASTQMTITSPEGMHFARALGVERVVLARELSLRELSKFDRNDPEGLPLEMFVHGALCVAYSGQCLTSESLGQRSANRGECAQACRLPYELVVDGQVHDLGDRKYLLSPQDLAAVNDIPALIERGVMSFKIEGRLKTPEYVAAVTQVYRRAIDRAVDSAAEEASSAASAQASASAPVPEGDWHLLELAFSRGLFSGWLHGVDHQRLVHARFGTKRGAFAGTLSHRGLDFVEFTPQVPLKAGDGVVFETGLNPDAEQGGRIFKIEGNRFYFQRGKLDCTKLAPGHRVWKNSDPTLERDLRKTFAEPLSAPERPVHFRVAGKAGEPLRLRAEYRPSMDPHDSVHAEVQSRVPLAAAQARALSQAVLREQLGRLGGTGFCLGELHSALEGDLFLPLSEVNEVRRSAIQALQAAALAAAPLTPAPNESPSGSAPRARLADFEARLAAKRATAVAATSLELSVLCRSLEQLRAALECGVQTLYVDFEDIRRYPEAVDLVRTQSQSRILLATPRIQKAGEQAFFKRIEQAQPHGVLIRNLGGLAHFQGSALLKVGDFSLNVANALTAELLADQGFEYLTIAYDLNHSQVEGLLTSAPPSWFELTLHQHMPLFHMEHCVFAAFLSEGHTYLDCGRPCERHELRLRDRVGVAHPVHVDVGCRNTVYHAKPQTGARYLEAFVKQGLRRVRVELVDENAERTTSLIVAYQELLQGRLTAAALTSRLKLTQQLGVSGGTLTVIR
jgi:U32 family peptidase